MSGASITPRRAARKLPQRHLRGGPHSRRAASAALARFAVATYRTVRHGHLMARQATGLRAIADRARVAVVAIVVRRARDPRASWRGLFARAGWGDAYPARAGSDAAPTGQAVGRDGDAPAVKIEPHCPSAVDVVAGGVAARCEAGASPCAGEVASARARPADSSSRTGIGLAHGAAAGDCNNCDEDEALQFIAHKFLLPNRCQAPRPTDRRRRGGSARARIGRSKGPTSGSPIPDTEHVGPSIPAAPCTRWDSRSLGVRADRWTAGTPRRRPARRPPAAHSPPAEEPARESSS